MNISDRGIFYLYGDPPAEIEAVFLNGSTIKAYVGENLSIFAVMYGKDGCYARNSKEASNLDLPLIEVLPQISAVLDDEKVLKKQTIDTNRYTRLASRNFRNQLFYYNSAFPVFKNLVESTWESLKVNPIESYFSEGGQHLLFYVRVGDFEAEIGWMGHGLQMWIQTMWFISQCPNNAIVVLDEPDVYMHADLQRRLVRLLTPMFTQLIIATHSIEIMEEAHFNSIIPIDSKRRSIQPIGEEKDLQELIEHLGSPLNIDLARLFISKKFMVWDGNETSRKILSAFQYILYPDEKNALISYPKIHVDGWKDWDKILTITHLLDLKKDRIQCFTILNPLSNSPSEISTLKKNAKKDHVNIHIWERYEIENYAISVDPILRFINHASHKGYISREALEATILQICNELIGDNSKEIQAVDSSSFNEALAIIPGKKFFKKLSDWTKSVANISVSALQVAMFFQPEEVSREVEDVIVTIVNGQKF